MKAPELYRGREQTYLKHFFLERYLERVAYKIGSFSSFTYVDGFSGPWQSADEAFEDTSFMIAVRMLRQVREGTRRTGRSFVIRCVFVEKDPVAFAKLQKLAASINDFQIRLINGLFEEVISDIVAFIGHSFSLTFIDPTGWKGFALNRIKPLLIHRPGEILVNFMYDYVNRFINDPRPELASSFNELFGGPGWESIIKALSRREEQIVSFYQERMRQIGDFAHVTHTRILKPIADRSYFYLVYGTRHPEGLLEFRKVEKTAIKQQDFVRSAAKQQNRTSRTGQLELLPSSAIAPGSFEQEEVIQRQAAQEALRRLIRKQRQVNYEDARTVLSEMPLLWESKIKEIILELCSSGEVQIRGLKGRERTPKPGHILVPLK